LCRFVDRSASDRTSDKLRTNVLYFEVPGRRFELARFTNEDYDPIYRLAEVDSPFYKDEAFFAQPDQSVPLLETSGDLKDVLVEKVAWNEFLWGINSVKIPSRQPSDKMVEIGPILNFLFRPCRNHLLKPISCAN